MNKIVLLLLVTLLALGACKKEPGCDIKPPPIPPEYAIKGLLFFDINALPAGKTGQPDDTLEASKVKLNPFPIPITEEFRFAISTRNTQDTAFTYRIAHVSYPAAPDSLRIYEGFPQRFAVPVIVENQWELTREATRGEQIIPEVAGQRSRIITVNTSGYLRGFYRLFIETNTGVRLRVAFYKG